MDQQLRTPTSGENWTGRAIPAARPLSDFSVERIDDDLVILDGETLQYHTLNGAASQIWRSCDGKTTSAEIADRLGLTIELVEITVADLGVAGLLESPADSFSWTPTMNRRRAMKLVAAGAAGAVGLPVVLSLTAPSHQAAATFRDCEVGENCDAGDECFTACPSCLIGLCALICVDLNPQGKGKLAVAVDVCIGGAAAPVVSSDNGYVEQPAVSAPVDDGALVDEEPVDPAVSAPVDDGALVDEEPVDPAVSAPVDDGALVDEEPVTEEPKKEKPTS